LHQAALHGSSHYDLPAFLRWFTANIGVHHVHHVCSRVPYYRLPRVLREHPELRAINRLTLLESFRGVRLVLWDETQRCLVAFHTARRQDKAGFRLPPRGHWWGRVDPRVRFGSKAAATVPHRISPLCAISRHPRIHFWSSIVLQSLA
jgi:hypothetical protein